jgi:hypothetical protein
MYFTPTVTTTIGTEKFMLVAGYRIGFTIYRVFFLCVPRKFLSAVRATHIIIIIHLAFRNTG